MRIISDLHSHSKYSRAVSSEMTIPNIWQWAKKKGIGLIATGDWTHPLWLLEIRSNLEEDGTGVLKLKNSPAGPRFLLATEISSIYQQGGKLRRIHNLIFANSLDTAEKISKELVRRGANLGSDGRPIIGLSSINLAELVFSVDSSCLLIPAHAWTPWFSLFGSMSGFDSIEECFGSFAKYIHAIETGLSSDPAMNWRIKELDNRSIVSFSDAHSGPKLGREATVFELEKLTFENIRNAIVSPTNSELKTMNSIAFTIEFYPEEGKYHYTGHRNCHVVHSPEDSKKYGTTCPVCGKQLTVGVMHRVEQLAGRSVENLQLTKKLLPGTQIEAVYSESQPNRPPFVSLVPLQEILAEALGTLPASQKVQSEYGKLVTHFGGEFPVLLRATIKDLANISGEKVSEAIDKVRRGDIVIKPGHDGVFGEIHIWSEEKVEERNQNQLGLFN